MPDEYFFPLYSLFHHNVYHSDNLFSFNTNNLLNQEENGSKTDIHILAKIIYDTVVINLNSYHDNEVSLTLTGGMDSRLILACLLKAGLKPNCFTYGNLESLDIIMAKKIAKKYNLKFHNVVNKEPSKEWYYKWVIETIKRDNGNSHLHRAHRTAAIAEHISQYSPKILFTGHMGGEGLRGLTYNNYFASPFFELVNEGKMPLGTAVSEILKNYYVKHDSFHNDTLIDKVKKLSWMCDTRINNKFRFLYDLVAKIHHAQDIRLFKSYGLKVIPVYLQEEYLNALFNSEFNFLTKREGFLRKIQNPSVYCKIVQITYPDLLDDLLTNGFTPNEYLKGLWYYIPVKILRKSYQKRIFPATFSYGKWYEEFIREHAHNIDPWIWDHYSMDEYFKSLKKSDHRTDEGYWHKFSNPVFFDLVNKYRTGKI